MEHEPGHVIGGVDTHGSVHVAAVVDHLGRVLSTAPFGVSTRGYRALVAWLRSHGTVALVGVEGTGSYGSGLARYLAREDIEVVEVDRPNRQARRRRGKSDTADAEAAARAALNAEATGVPKSHDGTVEAIRVLRVARRTAIKARTQCVLQIRDLLVTAPAELRRVLEPLENAERVARCTRLRPGDVSNPTEATKQALRCLARRCQALTGELDQLDEHLDRLTLEASPALRGAHGVGVDVAGALLVAAGDNPDRLRSEAAFAALCGVSPVEASSGKIVRHRLNRGGNREANHALWRIVMVRLSTDPTTRTYMQTRRTEGKTQREIMRCLKRYVAREVYRHLTHAHRVPTGAELRARRTQLGITLENAARPLQSWATRLSRLERGLDHNTQLAQRYETWLTEQAA